MDKVRLGTVRDIGYVFYVLALLLFAAGVVMLVAPWLSLIGLSVAQVPGLAAAISPLSSSSAGPNLVGFLGTLVTSLSVLVAILIGYNVGILQVTGETVSLALTKPILRALIPSVGVWLLTSGFALVYLVVPPIYLGPLLQVLFWFAAAALLMMGYLWLVPFRLSGRYAAQWAASNLRGQSVDKWEGRDGFSVLQAGMAAAIGRTDVSTVRNMSQVIVTFLTGVLDTSAERDPHYKRESYRALKDLLSGCAYGAADAPNAVNYNVGFVVSGVMLQAIAIGQPVTHDSSDIYSGLFLALQGAPERLEPMWTGVRHALCGSGGSGPSYLARYWRAREKRRKTNSWAADDGRWVKHVAGAIVRLHADCWDAKRTAYGADRADAEAADMLDDMYRYIAGQLAKRVVSERPLALLDAIHDDPDGAWRKFGDASRAKAEAAYVKQRDALVAALPPDIRARVPETVAAPVA